MRRTEAESSESEPLNPHTAGKENDPRMLCGGVVCGGRLNYFGDLKCPIAEVIRYELRHGLDPRHPNQIKPEAVTNLRTRCGTILKTHDCAYEAQLEEALVKRPEEFAEEGTPDANTLKDFRF